MNFQNVVFDLQSFADAEKAAFLPKFFKTGKGEYGEGDKFIGVTVPNQRIVAKKYLSLDLKEIEKLLASEIHEHRLTALLILVSKFEKAKSEKERKELFDFYTWHTKCVNNWDLVDLSAPNVVGAFLFSKEKDLLYRFAKSSNLWERRIAIVATLYFTRKLQFADAVKISELLLADEHDLIRKAVGWVLREVGKKDEETLLEFLDAHCKNMPRTALRYSIERLSEEKKKKYMAKS